MRQDDTVDEVLRLRTEIERLTAEIERLEIQLDQVRWMYKGVSAALERTRQPT
jgi:uncharacterized protein YlxW (UPF0749 family)